ncbi:tonsoku-like protein [Uranotaenia lowii]|uniref:tonsoku-like protein n=1 Tax=Uranotaenia lowii TaxID=190385 RepID=UPI00247AD14C|nr:tonsoku-like protein [Uranotaenia lowii]
MDLEEQRLIRRKKKSSEAGNLLQLAEACRKLGELYHERGEHRKALNEFKLVAKAYHNLKMPMEVGRANRLIGEMFMLLDEYEKALQYEKVYLDIAKREEDLVELQRAYVTIGRTYLLKGQSCEGPEQAKEPLAEAEKAFLKGLKLCHEVKGVGKIEQLDMEARALLNLGVTKEHQEILDDAIEYMAKATKIAMNNDLSELLHQCYISTALLFNLKQKNHSKALKTLNEALEVASRLHNKSTKMCETLLIKADVFIKMGDFQSAKTALKKAFKLKTPVISDAENVEKQLRVLVAICKIEDKLITIDSNQFAQKKVLYEQMGDGACKLENYSKAIDYYMKMLDCAQQNGETDRELIPIYVSLYQTYKDNKQYDEALEYLWKEYNLIQNVPKEAYNTLLSIAEVYENQNKSCFDVEDIYRRVRQEAKKLKSLKMERVPIKRCIGLLKKHGMDLMAENLEKEAKQAGIDLALEDDSSDGDSSEVETFGEETETSIEFAINAREIGEDVNLSELSDSDGDTPRAGDKSLEVRSTRKRGTTFQVKRNNKGETQLHQACINGNAMLVQKLLEQGHPVNIRDHAGWLPLHEACIHGHKEIVEMLLDRGAHINDKGGTSCDGITPLYDACSNGNLEVVELLLDRGANCTLRTDSGDTTVNVLEGWFKSVQKKLLDEHIVFYNTIKGRIMECFEKTGTNHADPTASVPDAIQVTSGETRASRRRNRYLGKNDSDSDKEDAKTVRTTGSNQSSGYGSAKRLATSSSKKRPASVRSDSSSISSDSDGERPTQHSFREQTSSLRKSSGVDDYRNAIQLLRKGNTVRAQIVSPLKDPNPGPAKRTAHMRREEVGDDWLIDDLAPNKKKQKFLSDNDYLEPNRAKRILGKSLETDQERENTPPISDQTITSTGRDCDSLSLSKLEDRRGLRGESSDESGPDAHDVLMGASRKSFHRKQLSGQSRSRRPSSNGSLRNQASLLDAGFSVSSRPSSPCIELLSPAKSTHSTQRTPIKSGAISTATATAVRRNLTPVKMLPPNMVRVMVEGKPIDVTYDDDRVMELNVGWLINEVVRRYGIKYGKHPLMKLLRQDSGICVETDPLTTLLGGSDTIINAYVIEMKDLRSDQFYEDYCKHRDVEQLSGLLSALSTMEKAGHLTIPKDFFHGKNLQWDILFQALGCQGRVRDLDLSCNQLSDQYFQMLVESLPALKQLEKVNLSMNLISSKGVASLSALIIPNPDNGTLYSVSALNQLTELDLSHNPLMDQSLLVLSNLCQHLKQLKVLRLASTGITNITFATPPLEIGQLQIFDVSDNSLNKKSVDYMLQKLNTRILTEFNLRSLGKLRDFKSALTITIQTNDFDMLRLFNLSNCGLTDEDLTVILNSLKTTAEQLKHLDASHNPKLTHKSLLEVLKTLTDHSLESVRFLQNPLILKNLPTTNLLEAIGFDRDKCYPYRIELMLPLKTSDEARAVLCELLDTFWKRLWTDRAQIESDRWKVRLMMRR